MRGLSLVVASGGHSSSRCAGLSLSWPLLLWSTGSRRTGSVIVAHGPSCSAACGIFPDQGSNPCPLHEQVDSQPLHRQGSPTTAFLTVSFLCGKWTKIKSKLSLSIWALGLVWIPAIIGNVRTCVSLGPGKESDKCREGHCPTLCLTLTLSKYLPVVPMLSALYTLSYLLITAASDIYTAIILPSLFIWGIWSIKRSKTVSKCHS